LPYFYGADFSEGNRIYRWRIIPILDIGDFLLFAEVFIQSVEIF
jgi:hypothetical protein